MMSKQEQHFWNTYLWVGLYVLIVSPFILWSQSTASSPRWQFTIVFKGHEAYTYTPTFRDGKSCRKFGEDFVASFDVYTEEHYRGHADFVCKLVNE